VTHTKTTALVHRCANTDDPPAFARALSVLGSSAQRAGALALLLDADGQILALAGSDGQIQTWNRVSVEPDPICLDFEGDGWFESASTVFYVHQGRPFSLMSGGRIAVAEIDELPPEASRIPDRRISAFLHAAAECVEAGTA